MMRHYLLLTTLFILQGCFLFRSDELDTPERKMAVLRVANDYLRYIAVGNPALAEGSVAWSDYGPNEKGAMDRQRFAALILMNEKRWKPEEHPLLGLDVEEVEVSGDFAEVKLRKGKSKERVELDLRWAGRGWLVTDDNIFSEDGIYTSTQDLK